MEGRTDSMKVTVCELPNDWTVQPKVQSALKDHLAQEGSELLLLPEMGFDRWLAAQDRVDPELWRAAVDRHLEWIDRLDEWGVAAVAGTRPALVDGKALNVGWVWSRESGHVDVHEKYYLPDEEGFYEATWYAMGNGMFQLAELCGLRVGFLICTEIWFTDRAREYAREGIDLLLCPRATPATSRSVWLAGGQAAAWVSGAYCLSSNYNGPVTSEMEFGGAAWVTEPDGGTRLGVSSEARPFVTVDIDPAVSRAAKTGYPRYVRE